MVLDLDKSGKLSLPNGSRLWIRPSALCSAGLCGMLSLVQLSMHNTHIERVGVLCSCV